MVTAQYVEMKWNLTIVITLICTHVTWFWPTMHSVYTQVDFCNLFCCFLNFSVCIKGFLSEWGYRCTQTAVVTIQKCIFIYSEQCFWCKSGCKYGPNLGTLKEETVDMLITDIISWIFTKRTSYLLFFRILKHAINYRRKFTVIIHCLHPQPHSCYCDFIAAFYRVLYNEQNYKLLTDYLKSEDHIKIHPINKAQLLDDSLNLARAGVLKYSIALDLTTYLERETDFIPWVSYFRALTFLNSRLTGTEAYENFKVTLSI